jgi:hypothetical protein
MKYMFFNLLTACSFLTPSQPIISDEPVTSFTQGHYSQWPNGPSTSESFFPLAVWLQNPSRAEQFRQAGFNVYIGLWKGPTENQLSQLKAAGMKVICDQNEVALRNLEDPTIIGWMHGDEPDNAQALKEGDGYGPPILPSKIVEDYQAIKKPDPSRPVLLNLGQGVAWDNYIGRGVRRNHPEDYPEYVKGCDIASFDIYPAVHRDPEIAGNLWYVGRGVERLIEWSKPRTVWNCLECTHISNVDRKPTPHEVRCEAWMSIIHGSRGLIYFIHQFKPVFREAALLDDPEMLRAVTNLNHQITDLAPVINSPTIADAVHVVTEPDDAPIATMLKKHGETTYLFAVGMRNQKTEATFQIYDMTGQIKVNVIGEDRSLTANNGSFQDVFEPWDVHLYRLKTLGLK